MSRYFLTRSPFIPASPLKPGNPASPCQRTEHLKKAWGSWFTSINLTLTPTGARVSKASRQLVPLGPLLPVLQSFPVDQEAQEVPLSPVDRWHQQYPESEKDRASYYNGNCFKVDLPIKTKTDKTYSLASSTWSSVSPLDSLLRNSKPSNPP